MRGQLNADLAGLVADVDNHIVIRGGAGLIQESGGQLHTILFADAIPIGIYITGLIQNLIGMIQVKAVHRLLHIAVGQVTGKEGIRLVKQAAVDIFYHGILINGGRNGLPNHLIAKDLAAQIIAHIVGLQGFFIGLSAETVCLLHLSIALGGNILDAGEKVHLTILHCQNLGVVVRNILDGETVYFGSIAPVIGIADKIPGLPVIIPGIHIGAGSISGAAEALLLGSQILIELLAGHDAEGVGKAQLPQGVVVGLCQVQFHRVLIGGHRILNDRGQAAIRAVVLAQVDRHSQNRLCHILGGQVRAIGELDALLDLEGIGFSILAHGPILGQHAHDLALGIVLKQGVIEAGEIVGNVVTGGGYLRGDNGVKILKAPALRQVQMYCLSLGVFLRVLAALCVGVGVASAGGQRYRHDRRREHSGNSFQSHCKSILSFVLSFQSVEVSTKPLASKSILLYGS